MNLIYVAFLLIDALCSFPSMVNGLNCKKMSQFSEEISDRYDTPYGYDHIKCWVIEVPENSYVRVELKELNANVHSCSKVYVKLFVNGANKTYIFCSQDTNRKPIIAFSDVTVTYYHHIPESYYTSSSFRLQFTIERSIIALKGISSSRINAINWLKNQRTKTFDWGKNTHRAITALYLSKATTFQSDDLEEELSAKWLELRTSIPLLRNASDPISIGELSMFVNALTVTCHNPRNFYGYDLVQILSDRVVSAKSTVPSAYLTLCNLNWTLSNSDVQNLANFLQKESKYPFHLDVRALTIMALTCLRNKTENFRTDEYVESLYQSTIQNFSGQLPDGSFGNIYTTALVTQALISSGQEKNEIWNATATAQYLMRELNSSSIDVLSVYLTLPIFSGKSLLDINTVDCSNKTRKEGKDVTDKIGGKTQIQYSLYIGDKKNVIHTIYLRMAKNSSAYDVMRIAEVADPKYKFRHRDVSDQMYVYEIADIVNDPEAGKFWLLYTFDHYGNDTLEHHTESPDRFILEDNTHLVMWYRTAHI